MTTTKTQSSKSQMQGNNALSQGSSALMWTILFVAFIQLSHFAIMPGIDLIAREIFPERSLQDIQTAMSLPNIISLITGVTAAMLVRYGLTSKRTMVLVGLMFAALTGFLALAFHTHFWHLCLMNASLGAGMGFYIPNIQSIMFDNFDENRRRFLAGFQAAFNNGGAIILSIAAGLLVAVVWYGGHLVTLAALPVLILSFITIPKDKKIRPSASEDDARTKIPGGVYYSTLLIFVFMIVYNVAGMNISTHIAYGNIGNSATAGVALALMMAGGVVAGLVFPKLSQIFYDYLFPLSFVLLFIGFSLMNLFPASLIMTLAAMALCGASLSLFMPRCFFNTSNLTDPTNSATATMLIACIAPGGGSFLSPVIMTNLTMLLGGDSTQFRYQFTAFVCLVLAVLTFIKSRSDGKNAAL